MNTDGNDVVVKTAVEAGCVRMEITRVIAESGVATESRYVFTALCALSASNVMARKFACTSRLAR